MSTTTALKKLMRKDIANVLAQLTAEAIKKQSAAVLATLKTAACLKNASKVGVYLSTDGEIITDDIVNLLFELDKEIFVPNFVKGSKQMRFVRLTCTEWTDGLPSTMWNIRQHDSVSDEQLLNAPLDLLLMPAVAFATDTDGTIKRLGHGMGYFDRFLHEQKAKYGKRPYLVGLALNEQIVDSVPLEDHDVPLNAVVSEQKTVGL